MKKKHIHSKLSILLSITLVLSFTPIVKASNNLFRYWIAQYNSPNNLDDRTYDIEIDSNGNIIVVGITEGGALEVLTLLKYDSEKNLLWQQDKQIYQAPYRIFAELDSEGNIFVAYTEYDPGSPTTHEGVVIKNDPMGNELWEVTSTWDVPTHPITDIDVDVNGDVYVAQYDWGIVKVDSEGTASKFYTLSPSLYELSDIEVDDIGNVYVTGFKYESDPSYADIYTSKFSPSGTKLWDDTFGGSLEVDYGMKLTLDDSGNVYVAGMSTSGDSIIKYGSDGIRQWTARYAGIGWDEARFIELDMNGNVYVSGISYGISAYDCLTVKFDNNGNRLWEARYDGPNNEQDMCGGLVLDSNDKVYITCASRLFSSPSTNDIVTILYDKDGNQLWLDRYDGPANGEDIGADIGIDHYGNVYVTGRVETDNGIDFLTIKYSELTASNGINSLIDTVEASDLEHGIENSLLSKLSNILKSVEKGRENAALNRLYGFINQVEALRGVKLLNEIADDLVAKAQIIINLFKN
jgi:outer membrane protein assembly factor BamB